jgi:hypothetical protein
MALAHFGPGKGFGAGVVLGGISIAGGLRVGDRVEDTAADALGKARMVAYRIIDSKPDKPPEQQVEFNPLHHSRSERTE